MNPLDQEQQRLKAEMDARKARHPYPGGWRANTQATELERYICNKWSRYPIELGPNGPVDAADLRTRTATEKPIVIVKDQRVMARFSWIIKNIIKDGWSVGGLSSFLAYHHVAYHLMSGKRYYDVGMLVEGIVATKTHTEQRIRASVASLVQGPGSINDNLLAFVENGAE